MTTPDVPYRLELELTVPGTPDQVWHAIASASGVTAWMVPAEFEARVGSPLTFHMGPDDVSKGQVTAYEPTRRFAYEEDWATLTGHAGADVTPLVTEFLVEARSGGTCVVRVVTSAFGSGEDWEDEFFEEMQRGWVPMLDNLRLYLTDFAGQAATPMWCGASFPASPEAAIDAVTAALGVGSVGDRFDTLDTRGRLERTVPRHAFLRLDAPVEGYVSLYAFGTDEGAGVHLQGYLFGDGAREYAEHARPRWQAWLEATAADLGSVEARRP